VQPAPTVIEKNTDEKRLMLRFFIPLSSGCSRQFGNSCVDWLAVWQARSLIGWRDAPAGFYPRITINTRKLSIVQVVVMA